MVTPVESPDASAAVSAALDKLRAALTQLRTLSEQPSADPSLANAVEQIEAIVARIESRMASSAGVLPEPPTILDPVPPHPG